MKTLSFSVLIVLLSSFQTTTYSQSPLKKWVINPNGNESFCIGQQVDIYLNWVPTTNGLKKVDLYLGDDFVLNISNSSSGSDHIVWTIPMNLENSDNYKIKVYDELNPLTHDFSDRPFSICNDYDWLQTPVGDGQNYTANVPPSWSTPSVIEIEWQIITTSSNTVKLELVDSDLNVQYVVCNSCLNNGSFDWSLLGVQINKSNLKIRISDPNDASKLDYSIGYFNIYLP